jgi:twinkle protein
MQTTEINGFVIDQFNIHGLEEGKAQGTCPVCSHDRKPKNQKAKCASYDWERGLGTCHNCNKSFQLHTYQRKGKAEKVYERPKPLVYSKPQTKVEEWFKTRGISAQTLQDLKITEGPEFMPQTGKTENTIKFNYFVGGELTNVKYRDGRKNFKLYKGAEKVFYNIDSIVGWEYCIIVEGEMDVLALHEAGITNAISVPNGATLNTNNLDYLDNCIDYFEDKDKIILAVDSDEAGQALQQELIRRLGAEVCYLVDFNGCKDANEYLLEYGPEKLAERISRARPVPLENVTTFRDIENEVTDFVTNGFKPGFQIGLQVNLLLLLVSLVPVRVTLSTKWLLGIMLTMVGRQHSLVQKMRRHIYMLIS